MCVWYTSPSFARDACSSAVCDAVRRHGFGCKEVHWGSPLSDCDEAQNNIEKKLYSVTADSFLRGLFSYLP